MHIVVYLPGTAGDLVTAVIDSTDYQLDNYRLMLPYTNERNLFKNNVKKSDYPLADNYLKEFSTKYLSLASHASQYHIIRKHKFISIEVTDEKTAQWCCNRLVKIFPNHQELHKFTPSYHQVVSKTLKQHTDRIINLSDILGGNLIKVLSQWVDTPLDTSIYEQWLNVIFSDKQNTIYR